MGMCESEIFLAKYYQYDQILEFTTGPQAFSSGYIPNYPTITK